MNGDGQHSLVEVKQEVLAEIGAVDRKVEALDGKVDATKQELLAKIGAVDRKVEAVDGKVDATKQELLAEIGAVDRKVEALDGKLDATKQELLAEIGAVDRKVDALAGELHETRTELINIINGTAIALEHRIVEQTRKISAEVAEAAADAAVQRVIGTVWERAAYDASVLDDKLRATDSRLDKHVSDENIHLPRGSKPR